MERGLYRPRGGGSYGRGGRIKERNHGSCRKEREGGERRKEESARGGRKSWEKRGSWEEAAVLKKKGKRGRDVGKRKEERIKEGEGSAGRERGEKRKKYVGRERGEGREKKREREGCMPWVDACTCMHACKVLHALVQGWVRASLARPGSFFFLKKQTKSSNKKNKTKNIYFPS